MKLHTKPTVLFQHHHSHGMKLTGLPVVHEQPVVIMHMFTLRCGVPEASLRILTLWVSLQLTCEPIFYTWHPTGCCDFVLSGVLSISAASSNVPLIMGRLDLMSPWHTNLSCGHTAMQCRALPQPV